VERRERGRRCSISYLHMSEFHVQIRHVNHEGVAQSYDSPAYLCEYSQCVSTVSVCECSQCV
jgi:hypothetical protein